MKYHLQSGHRGNNFGFMNKIVLALVAIITGSVSAQTPLIPADRKIDWSKAGVPGGVPNRTAICADITKAPYNADNTGMNDASAAINSAISNCNNSNGVVYLPAGTYAVNAPITLPTGGSNFTIRGAGAGNTILKLNNSYITTEQGGESGNSPIAAGYTKGSTSITVSNTTNVAVGAPIVIFQDNDPSLCWSDTNVPDELRQVVMVTGIEGQTITFSPALAYTLSASLNPSYSYFNTPTSNFVGLENLTIDGKNTTGSGGAGNALVAFWNTYGCWVKGVEAKNIPVFAFFFYMSLSDEVVANYVHDGLDSNESHAFVLYKDADNFLIENNIATNLWSLVMTDNTIGTVIDYNFSYNNRTGPYQGPYFSSGASQVAAYNIHFGHGMMDLFEGNVGEQWQNDGYHGSASHQTLFRNWFNGLNGLTASSKYPASNRIMIEINQHGYYHNVVANVLGDSSWVPSQYEMNTQNWTGDASTAVIYRLGYPNMGNNSLCDSGYWNNVQTNSGCLLQNPSYPGQWMPAWQDTFPFSSGGFNFQGVKPTLIRTANFDYLHNSVWNDFKDSAMTTAEVTNLKIPASLYYSAIPSWWPSSIAWPPVGPDVTGGNIDTHVNKIPAQVCYEQGMMPDCFQTTTGIKKELKSVMNVTVYPNPANDKIFIEGSLTSPELVHVSIFAVDGKMINGQTFNFQTEKEMDVSTLLPGLYFVQITNANFSLNQKIVICR